MNKSNPEKCHGEQNGLCSEKCSCREPATRSFRAKHAHIYSSVRGCEKYDVLSNFQDYQGAISSFIHNMCPLNRGMAVLDLGAGTGKLTRLVAPLVSYVLALDRAELMLRTAERSLQVSKSLVGFAVADIRNLPCRSGVFDLVLVGWTLSSLKSEFEEWYEDGSAGGTWRAELDSALAEVDRALKPGGVAIIFESQGTASSIPSRQGSWLYAHLRQRGYREQLIRTDYKFPSKAVALETLLHFFGKGASKRAAAILSPEEDPAEKIPDEGCIIPECTGVWWRRME
mmetsp:Transcript_8342/g.18170  ORF Transcript_8342/g.18170 Transcript_8342/m.18170 type:complete len:285 (+) Transcript_8342:201-1055(+)